MKLKKTYIPREQEFMPGVLEIMLVIGIIDNTL
jgi:hypothetical protein